MPKQIVIFIAPPGAGKGTQAELFAKKFGLEHVETSKLIEEKFRIADPADKEIQEEKQKWLEGELVSPRLFAGWFNEVVRELAMKGVGIVTSGSFRTVEETEIILPELERLYGRNLISCFYIKLSEEESVKRNSSRRICEKNRHPIPNFPEYQNLTTCPQDGSPMMARELDKPEVIRERYKVFWQETAPVLDYLKQHGYKVVEINGEQPIEKVFEDILKNF